MNIADGLYDTLVTESLARALAELGETSFRTLRSLHAEEAGERLAEALSKQLVGLLDELNGEGVERARRQLSLINEVIVYLRRQGRAPGAELDPVTDPPRC